jgi:uncharacterized protein (TIGR02453 family)
MTFTGFPDAALVFYEGLEADNSKAYWTDHKPVYDDAVAGPMRELLAELEPVFGEGKAFRPYRDVRFSKDKTPYKTRQDAVVPQEGGVLWLGLGADGLHLGGGLYRPDGARLARLRAAVADDRTGEALSTLLEGLVADNWDIGGERLVRVPRPWDATHPRADLLRHKSLIATTHHEPAPWLHTAEAKTRIRQAWEALAPLNAWFTTHT